MLLMLLSCSPSCHSIIRCRIRLAFDETLKAFKARLSNIGHAFSFQNSSRERVFLVALIYSRLELGFEEGFEKKRERVLNKIFTIFFLFPFYIKKFFLFRDEKFRCFGLLCVHKSQRKKAASGLEEKKKSIIQLCTGFTQCATLTAIRLLPGRSIHANNLILQKSAEKFFSCGWFLGLFGRYSPTFLI